MDKAILAKAHTKQKKGVCVLNSYAVAASVFIDKPVQEYLEAYCGGSAHKIASASEAEEMVERTWSTDADAAKRSGYQHLAHVHSTFKEEPFSTASSKFKLKPVTGGNAIEDLKSALKANPKATALLAVHPQKEPAHSVAIAYDERDGTLVISDPNREQVQSGPISAFTGFTDNSGAPVAIGEAVLLEPT
jgi:hypothetical protein